jgi:transposase InsO family protein
MDEKPSKKTYVEAPKVDAQLQSTWEAILGAYVGMIEVSEGARRLGLSRNHFQTKMHTAMAAAVETLLPKPKGRPPKPQRERELEEENDRLRRELGKAQQELETVNRILGVATAFVKERSRTSRTKKEKAVDASKKEDPDGEARAKLQVIEWLRAQGLKVEDAVNAVVCSKSTYGRYKVKSVRGEKLVHRRGPGPKELTPEVRLRIEERARATHGTIGAAPLAKQVGGSRRDCAKVLAELNTTVELERKATTMRVSIAAPGIIRGMDQKYVHGRERVLLICADGQVPYRTTITAPERYDAEAVVDVLARDISEHGAPLVYRMDRASVHRVPDVKRLLADHRVLQLHGPPRRPQYYGQTERQNRENEAWLSRAWWPGKDLLVECETMKTELNLVPRRTLGWQSARTKWENRPEVEGWRDELWNEVQDRVARNWRQCEGQARIEDVERLVIEDALISRGLVRIEPGGWC